MMWFEIVAGKNIGQKLPLCSQADSLRIGRGREATVQLDSSTIALHHAEFIPEGRSLTCCQAAQGYLTRKNGVPAAAPFQVSNCDELQFGEFVLQFRADRA